MVKTSPQPSVSNSVQESSNYKITKELKPKSGIPVINSLSLAGQEQYRAITMAYLPSYYRHYRKAVGALVVYDITK
jgi:hypothetical protein